MRRMLLLGGSAQQIVAIETAKRLGLYTVLCDYLPDNPGKDHADKFYQTSTTDKEAILDVARRENIDYIIAYASDPAAPTAAYVAEKLGLPTNPYAAVETLCNKDLFRRFLKENGFHTPRAEGFREKEAALAAIGSFELPVIVKPVDSSGSKGATVLRSPEGLAEAVDFAFSFSRAHRIIIEEFIEKKHAYLVGGDIFVSGGKVIQWGLMNCHRDSRVNPLVPVGKSYPPLLEPADLAAVKETLQTLVTKLGVNFGPMNVELIVDAKGRAFPIDIGPRSGGNMIPDLLGMIFDCNVVEMSVRAAMGEPVTVASAEGRPYYATLNLHSERDGSFARIDFTPEIERYIIRKNIYKKPGDEVRRFANAADALGIVFFHFDDADTMHAMLGDMSRYVTVVLQEDLA
ncbi:MAG: ATP-grasp domain-containing protein [Clostridia bacterium]|nr:ATP-grasp domain-containing protein [Clostridia bacterium]